MAGCQERSTSEAEGVVAFRPVGTVGADVSVSTSVSVSASNVSLAAPFGCWTINEIASPPDRTVSVAVGSGAQAAVVAAHCWLACTTEPPADFAPG